MAVLYRSGWSAEEMIGTEVRGENGEDIGDVKDIIVDRNGNISKVVVEAGGFLWIGDQHIGVPWKDVKIGRDMAWVQVPLKEVESGTYSLFGEVPQGEQVPAALTSWRVNELIGEYASLEDARRYGLVTDVIFSEQGKAQGIIIDRAAGRWGAHGRYAYPYYGFYPGAFAYPLPYRSADVLNLHRFDYVQLGQQSAHASDRSKRARQQQAQARQGSSQQSGAAAGGATQGGYGKDVIMQVQKKLNDKGFDAGAVNGVMGSTTRRALENFQQKQGMKATGELDSQTLAALDIERTQSR